MSKYDNAYFEYTIKPEDSKFLKSWNELRKDPNFRKKLRQLERELDNNSQLLITKNNVFDYRTTHFFGDIFNHEKFIETTTCNYDFVINSTKDDLKLEKRVLNKTVEGKTQGKKEKVIFKNDWNAKPRYKQFNEGSNLSSIDSLSKLKFGYV